MALQPEDRNLALYCDFENIALGVRDAKYRKFNIQHVLERLLVKGSIVVKKAYCDWDRYKEFKGPMHEAAFELIEIPHVRMSGKNSADIRMVVDALDLCYTKSHVDTFVIISGDSDFSPLVSKLRENAKTVIGVGVKNSTSDLLISNCDEFIYYDDLVRELERQRTPPRGGEAAAGKGRGGRKRSGRSGRGRGAGDVNGAANGAANGATQEVSRGDAPAAPAVSDENARPDAVPDVEREAEPADAGHSRSSRSGRGGRGRRGSRGDADAAPTARDEPPADGAGAEGPDVHADVRGDAPSGRGAPAPAARTPRKSDPLADDYHDVGVGDDDDDDEAFAFSGAAHHGATADEGGEDAPEDDEAFDEDDEDDVEDDESSDEARRQEGIDIVYRTAAALSAERGGKDKLWGSMVKQTLKRRRPGFNESYYGFDSFSKMLEEAEAQGLVTLEADDRSGGYVILDITG